MAWTWRLLRAGELRLDGGGMFGVVPKSLWARLTEPDDQNRIRLHANCLLLENGSDRVLVETGFGDKWSDKERGFYALERRSILDALAEADVDPGDIDHVVVTHLHFDHAGGLTHLDADGEPTSSFPNARVHLQRTEWEDANANKAVMTRTYLKSHLDPVADQVVLHRTSPEHGDASEEILLQLRVRAIPGHTWGQQAVVFRDAAGTVCFTGDVLPTVHHAAPAFNMGYDVEPYTNMLTKARLLEQAAAEDWRLVLPHEPDHPVVRVKAIAETGRFELVPE